MARSFNGSSDIIDVGQPSVLNFTSAFTLSAWMNISTLPAPGANYAVIAAKGYDGTIEQYALRFSGTKIDGTGSGQTFLQIFYFDGSQSHGCEFIASSGGVSTAVWHHIVGLWSGSAWALFVDGVSVGATSGTQIAPTHAAADFSIGGEMISGSAARFFPGLITDVAAWNTNLSAGQITQLFNAVRPISVQTANLQGWWPLDGFASPETDASGNGNTGTLTGTLRDIGPPQLWRISGSLPGVALPAAGLNWMINRRDKLGWMPRRKK